MLSFFEKLLRPHKKLKPAFSNSAGLKSIFEKLRFRDGLAHTVGLTGKYRGILVYNICLISISNSVSDGATNKSVLNIESS